MFSIILGSEDYKIRFFFFKNYYYNEGIEVNS